MCLRANAALSVLAILPVLAPGSAARAWTEANVQSVSAHAHVDASGRATVNLVLTVRIGGGWLEGLDVEGLDPDLILSTEKPPWAVSVNDPNLTWSPRARVRNGGRIRLAFPDRGSPRRGAIRVGLTYTTELTGGTQPIEDGRVRISWTLPGWRTGLDNVEVTLTTPLGAIAASAMDDGAQAADEHHEIEDNGTATHVFRRVHLPRTVPWIVSVDVPADAMDAALRGATIAAAPNAPDVLVSDAPITAVLSLVLLLLATVAFSRVSFAARARALGMIARPVVSGPLWLVLPAIGCMGAIAVISSDAEPLLALVTVVTLTAFAMQRTPQESRESRDRVRLLPCPPSARSAARRAHRFARVIGSPLLDLTTGFGALAFAALLWSAIVVGELTSEPSAVGLACIVLLAVPFVTATRFHLPTGPDGQLHALVAFAGATDDLGPVALSLVLGRDESASVVEARLRLSLLTPPEGLERLDVVLCRTPVLGGFESTPALLVVTRGGSDAEERLVAHTLTPPIDGPDGFRARIIGGPDPARAIFELTRALLAAA